jgi:hypothetical protein
MMMVRGSYNFVKFKHKDTYSNILDLNKKPRIITFQEKKDANKYIDYMAEFRAKYGYWQRIDLSEDKEEIRSTVFSKKRSQDMLRDYLEIETVDDDELQMIFSMHTISLLHCYKFQVETVNSDKYNIYLSAQEIESVPNDDKYIKMLNRKLHRK